MFFKAMKKAKKKFIRLNFIKKSPTTLVIHLSDVREVFLKKWRFFLLECSLKLFLCLNINHFF